MLIDPLEPRRLLSFAIKVNFQPQDASPPSGYRVDTGSTYATRANGFKYGWNVDNKADARDRNSTRSPNQAYDTINHFQRVSSVAARKWEISVPNGTYRVRVVAGDPSFFNDIHKIAAEGKTVVNAIGTTTKPWVDGTTTVTVSDGRLTLTQASGGKNAKIAFTEITQIENPPPQNPLLARINEAVAYAETALTRTLNDIGNSTSVYVERTDGSGAWKKVDKTHWTAGFLPGAMWQLRQLTGKSSWGDKAKAWTLPLASQVNQTGDLAFKFLTTYLPLYQMTGNAAYRQVLLDAAASKNRQWNETVGAFRTDWFTTRSGNPRANYAVLMDMTTDLELLLWAGRETGNAQYRDRAIRHMEKVVANQVRADGSISQFGMYDKANGDFIMQETYQGYANSSAWSRGQAWAILSFTAVARDTGRSDFLAAARKVADYFINHLPSDQVPYWDFNDPAIPNTFRDSSAAAVAASGMLELSRVLTDAAEKARYKSAAERILTSLLSSKYWAQGSIHRGLLLHGAKNVPNETGGRDNSLIYGDYYLLKAMNQYRAM